MDPDAIRLLNSLRGAPASLLLALLAHAGPLGRQELALLTGWGETSVSAGLCKLAALGLARRQARYHGWQATPAARRLVLEFFPPDADGECQACAAKRPAAAPPGASGSAPPNSAPANQAPTIGGALPAAAAVSAGPGPALRSARRRSKRGIHRSPGEGLLPIASRPAERALAGANRGPPPPAKGEIHPSPESVGALQTPGERLASPTDSFPPPAACGPPIGAQSGPAPTQAAPSRLGVASQTTAVCSATTDEVASYNVGSHAVDRILAASRELFGEAVLGPASRYPDPRLLLGWMAQIHRRPRGIRHPARVVYTRAGRGELPDPEFVDDPLGMLPVAFLQAAGLPLPPQAETRQQSAPPLEIGEALEMEPGPPPNTALELPAAPGSPFSARQAWELALEQVRLGMPPASFAATLAPCRLLAYDPAGGLFNIAAPGAHARDWLQARLASALNRQLAGLCRREVQVRFVVEDS